MGAPPTGPPAHNIHHDYHDDTTGSVDDSVCRHARIESYHDHDRRGPLLRWEKLCRDQWAVTMYADGKRKQTINEVGGQDSKKTKEAKEFCKRVAQYIVKVYMSASQTLVSSSDIESKPGVGHQQQHYDVHMHKLSFEKFCRTWRLGGVSDLAISLVYNLLQP